MLFLARQALSAGIATRRVYSRNAGTAMRRCAVAHPMVRPPGSAQPLCGWRILGGYDGRLPASSATGAGAVKDVYLRLVFSGGNAPALPQAAPKRQRDVTGGVLLLLGEIMLRHCLL